MVRLTFVHGSHPPWDRSWDPPWEHESRRGIERGDVAFLVGPALLVLLVFALLQLL